MKKTIEERTQNIFEKNGSMLISEKNAQYVAYPENKTKVEIEIVQDFGTSYLIDASGNRFTEADNLAQQLKAAVQGAAIVVILNFEEMPASLLREFCVMIDEKKKSFVFVKPSDSRYVFMESLPKRMVRDRLHIV